MALFYNMTYRVFKFIWLATDLSRLRPRNIVTPQVRVVFYDLFSEPACCVVRFFFTVKYIFDISYIG